MGPPLPAPGQQQPGHRAGKPALRHDLPPTEAHGEVTGEGRREVPVEVGPPVQGGFVPEPTVQLDDQPTPDARPAVLDVPVGGRPPEPDPPLPLPRRQPVRQLDPGPVAVLEDRSDPRGRLVDDGQEQPAVRQTAVGGQGGRFRLGQLRRRAADGKASRQDRSTIPPSALRSTDSAASRACTMARATQSAAASISIV